MPYHSTRFVSYHSTCYVSYIPPDMCHIIPRDWCHIIPPVMCHIFHLICVISFHAIGVISFHLICVISFHPMGVIYRIIYNFKICRPESGIYHSSKWYYNSAIRRLAVFLPPPSAVRELSQQAILSVHFSSSTQRQIFEKCDIIKIRHAVSGSFH